MKNVVMEIAILLAFDVVITFVILVFIVIKAIMEEEVTLIVFIAIVLA